MSLSPCASCQRHISERELACPFCRAPRRALVGPTVQALVIAFATTVAGDAAAQASPAPPTDAGAADAAPDPLVEIRPIPLYGAPPGAKRGCGCETVGDREVPQGAVGAIAVVAATVAFRRRTTNRRPR